MDFSQSYSDLQQSGFVVKQMKNGFEAHGIYKGYSILNLIQTNVRNSNAFITFSLESNSVNHRIFKQIKQALGRAIVVQEGCNVKITTTICTDSTNQIMVVIDKIAECFAANNIRPKSRCCICGREGSDCAVIHDGGYTAAHVDCVKHQIAQNTNTAAKQANGNIFTGIIGAILGAIIGAIPTILTIGLTDRIFGLLCVLVPMCSYWGYNLFKGKVNRATVWIISILSILQAFGIVIFSIWIYSDFVYSPLYCALLFIAYMSDFSQTLGTTLVFIGIGIFASWGYIKRRPTDYVVSAQVAQESALYYDFGGTGASPYAAAQVSTAQENLPSNMQDSNV